jgi:hypothetical protein
VSANGIQQQKPIPSQRRDWCCGTPIAGPHITGCAFEPREDNAPDYEALTAPPAPVASEPRKDKEYGFSKAEQALDAIAALMDGAEWHPGTLDNIAEIVRGTGRQIGDLP